MSWKRPPYAGGSMNITHVDKGALEWMETLGCRTLLDVGCGPGGQVQVALDMGWGAFGIDVDDQVVGDRNVALIDLATNPVIFHRPFDLVWSIEVAEHVPEEHEDDFIETLTTNSAKYIILTANQDDRLSVHVNCKPREHWVGCVEAKGFSYSEVLYQSLLKHSTMEREFLVRTGMVFQKNSDE